MPKQRTHLFAGLCSALILAAIPAAASAQSCTTTPTYRGSSSYNTTCGNLQCTTSPTYLGSSSYDTTCNSTSSYALLQLYTLQAEQQYLQQQQQYLQQQPAQQAQADAAAAAARGITVTDQGTGQRTDLPAGTFVRIGEAPAIYRVYGGQLHAFSTWPQFLNAGGRSDLSNVVRYGTLNGDGLFGQPIP